MARPHSGLDSLTRYLRTGFPWKSEWKCEALGMTFDYEDVKSAMLALKKSDPGLHRLLSYRWQTTRSRNAIANALYLDPSTLKRSWDKAMHQVVNYLVNRDVYEELEAIDLVQYD